MVKIHINKSNPNFNGFECAFFCAKANENAKQVNERAIGIRRKRHLDAQRKVQSAKNVTIRQRFCVIYYFTCTFTFSFPLKFSIWFYHSRDDFIQFTPTIIGFFFLSLPKASSMNHRLLLPLIFHFFFGCVCFFSISHFCGS